MTAKISDIYTLYLKPVHLPPDGCNVTITAAEVRELHPRPGTEEIEHKLILSFKSATRKLIVNQTQANRLVDLLGEDYTAWVGKVVHLSANRLNKNQQTILVGPARNGKGNQG
jgi:hypothetical protein